MWIVFALSGVAWFSIGNAASIAASPCSSSEVCTSPPSHHFAGGINHSTTGYPVPASESQPDKELKAAQLATDPELGNLRVRELEVHSPQSATEQELGNLRLRNLEVQPPQSATEQELGNLRLRELEVHSPQSATDQELGNLRLREQEFQSPKPEVQLPRLHSTAHLLARVSYFQTNNVFSGVDPVDGGLFSSGLTLWAAPALGSKTNLVAVIDGNIIGYLDQSQFDYNQLTFRTGIRQRLTPRMYGEIGWNNQQLFRVKQGDRFLNENAIRLALYRQDQLTNKLALSTLYEFRLSNANPDNRSRMINALSLSLSYSIRRDLQVGLDYQFGLSNFTQSQREDQYHRLLGRLTYAVSRGRQINVQGGLSLGGSSDPNIDFNNFFFSVTYTVDLGNF